MLQCCYKARERLFAISSNLLYISEFIFLFKLTICFIDFPELLKNVRSNC